jgi:membrane protein
MSRFNSLITFFQQAYLDWRDPNPSRMAAALAFRGIFSLVPALLIVTIMTSLAFGREIASAEIEAIVSTAFSPEIAEVVLSAVSASLSLVRQDSTVILLVSLLIMVYAATTLAYELKLSLNTIWGIPYAYSVGPIQFIKNRLIALAVILGIGLVVLVTIVINAVISLLVSFFLIDSLLALAGLLASFGLIILLIALIFKFLPDVTVPWRAVWLGALVTSILLTVGIWGLGVYLALSSIGAAFGAAGVLLATLIWLYYSAHIFIVGAAFTRSYARRLDIKVENG